MNHSVEDLLLAAKVLDISASIASKLRREEWHAWSKAQPQRPSQEASDAKHRELEVTHPDDAYVPQALGKLTAVAERIKAPLP